MTKIKVTNLNEGEEKAKKAPKKSLNKSLVKPASKKMNVYSSLVYKNRARADRRARKEAEDLAKLPKEPVKRFFAKLHPKRVAKFVFSMKGLKFFLKVGAAGALVAIILIGGLFLYYKKDLEEIRLDQLKVSETVNTYLDRNDEVLWEDKGTGDYRLVVDGDSIATHMRQATVAIEDRQFYNHPGVDFSALIRAGLSTLTGKGVQGGSTLTQQLIKQVYFSDEASNRTVTGIPRKIKEMILALEVEKMYSKEQIITMYLNESPYGGRRNGVESAAQTYFGKTAKDLNLAESALLAAIPNNPGVLNPYNHYGHQALIARQQKTLDVMAELGYVSKEEAEEAKKVAVLDQILPESNQYNNIKAPHFVLEVKKQLEQKYGVKTMRAGGFTIKTSLDYRAQKLAEAAVATGKGMMYLNRSNNIALASVDVETAQVLAMVGSSDWEAPIYGQVNAATALLEPGSTIKPILDYAPLFIQREGQNFGPGSILRDENIDRIYCAGYSGSCALRNASNRFYGNLSIRKSLGNSLNIGAVKSLYINGLENSLKVAHELGDLSYCTDTTGGLSVAIGSGCNVRAIEHANAYASLARGGVYKPLAYVLEVKNSAGEVIESWVDNQGKRVVDEQVAFLIQDILGDASARTITFGSQATSFGFQVPGVWTGSKTGTTTTALSSVTKDSWMASFSPSIATVVWNGKHDGSGLVSSTNAIVRRVVNDYMGPVHRDLYASEGKWKPGDRPVRPAGIQELTVNGMRDLWPSWYNAKTSGITKTNLTFNKYTKKLASDCTPEAQKISIEVMKSMDPMSKSEIWSVPEGYDRETQDDCSYRPPEVTLHSSTNGSRTKIQMVVTAGTAALGEYELAVNGEVTEKGSATTGSTTLKYEPTGSGTKKLKITVKDALGYMATDTLQI
ncbi:MAG: transglycosylase domain-containing protein [Candidatus Saccharibacteria bacterium]|nr:transglycosylase domain-containing protein [Candidatus Saccharibacteria bacterium]